MSEAKVENQSPPMRLAMERLERGLFAAAKRGDLLADAEVARVSGVPLAEIAHRLDGPIRRYWDRRGIVIRRNGENGWWLLTDEEQSKVPTKAIRLSARSLVRAKRRGDAVDRVQLTQHERDKLERTLDVLGSLVQKAAGAVAEVKVILAGKSVKALK